MALFLFAALYRSRAATCRKPFLVVCSRQFPQPRPPMPGDVYSAQGCHGKWWKHVPGENGKTIGSSTGKGGRKKKCGQCGKNLAHTLGDGRFLVGKQAEHTMNLRCFQVWSSTHSKLRDIWPLQGPGARTWRYTTTTVPCRVVFGCVLDRAWCKAPLLSSIWYPGPFIIIKNIISKIIINHWSTH